MAGEVMDAYLADQSFIEVDIITIEPPASKYFESLAIFSVARMCYQ